MTAVATPIATVLAATLYLMNAHARRPCPAVAAAVHQHLECLARHAEAAPVVRELARRIAGDWIASALPARRTELPVPRPASLH
jgi:hypothetical protein